MYTGQRLKRHLLLQSKTEQIYLSVLPELWRNKIFEKVPYNVSF